MEIKAVFIDLDGTLLTDDLTISPGSKDVLKRLNRAGILVVIVTARSPAASIRFYAQLEMSANPIVCFNGALIQRQNDILHDIRIETPSLTRMLDALKGFEVTVSMYRHGDWFVENIDKWIQQEIDITKSGITQVRFKELLATGFQPNKMLLIGSPLKIDEAKKHLHNTGAFPHLTIHKSKTNYLEIMSDAVSKVTGIRHLLGLYNIDRDEIITIGDNYNDIDMLSFSKTSVAMGNAPAEVKKHATFVTDTNNNEGIKKALDMLIP